MMRSIVTKTFLLSWIFYGSLVAVAQDDLTVKAHVDNTIIGLNQQFTLHVELSGKGVNSASNPELPKMDDFASYLGSGSSQNFQYINGRMSVSKTISYHFQATAVGKFQIGPIIVTAGGKRYQTDPIVIDIQKTPSQSQPSQRRDAPVQGTGPAEGDLFLRATVNKKQVCQNEPVIVTYMIYTRVNLASFGYSKLPGTAGFWVEEFPQARQPETHSEILEGKSYTIATIKKMALFPMSPGKKTIDPLEIECEVRVRQRSRGFFDDFFNDPFGRTVSKSVKSKPVNVEVLPLPEEGKPPDFSGVVGQFKIIGTVDKSSVKTNEAVSFKVKIEGKGNIRTLPEPKVVFPSDFESYPPKITENIDRKGLAVSGSKTYEYVLVPRVPGLQKIKPVRLSTFNPVTKKYKTLQTDEIIIDVAKGNDLLTVTPTGLSKEEVKLLGQDIRFIKTEIPSFQKIGAAFYKNILFWIIGIFPLLCLGGALGYRRHLDRLHGDVAYARDRRASRSARKHLSAAKPLLKLSTQKDFYSAVGKALMGYLGNKLNIAEAGMITEDAQRMLRDRGVTEETIKSYFDCLNTCDLKRFSPMGTNEIEMKEFFKKAEREIVRLDRAISK